MPATAEEIFPPQFIAAVRRLAERDAHAVAGFLRGLPMVDGFPSPSHRITSAPAEALIGIGLAMRFRRWELENIRLHLDAGLPSGQELLIRVLTELAGEELSQFVASCAARTLRLYHEHFLWLIDDLDLASDMAMVMKSDPEFIDAMANFLIEQTQRTN